MSCGVVLRMVKKRWWLWWWWCPFLHGCFRTFHHLECPYPQILHQNHYCLPIKSQFKLHSLQQAGVRGTFSDLPEHIHSLFSSMTEFFMSSSFIPAKERGEKKPDCMLLKDWLCILWLLVSSSVQLAFIVYSISICWNNILLGIELETRIQNGSFMKLNPEQIRILIGNITKIKAFREQRVPRPPVA